ncbi:stAR-related lipid transfer protein 5 isoform X2 [Panthera tigris]|uniref:stAR-related lipid transfer protein 5 isoform X2 n=1 Tax=Panthera tigris TaxID=9694 RepID=UPI001C6F9592|nr:stAR-related lipid transfer protein 5 isoform X2 [Panthera tigris]
MDPALAAQMGEAVAEKMLQYRQDKSGWKICREANGVSVSWRPSMEFPGNLYRGEGIVNGTPEKVWGCVKPLAGTLRDQWDENVSSFEIIESITDERGILRQESGVEAGRVVTKNKSLLLVLLHNAVYQQNRHPLGRHEAHFPQRFRGLGVGQEVRGWDSQLQRCERGTSVMPPEAGVRERVQPPLWLLLRTSARGARPDPPGHILPD